MSASDIFFYIFSAGAVAGSLFLLTAKNPMKAAFSLLFVFLCTGLIYLSKGLNFLAAAQIIIYAGAVMSLFVVALPAMVFSQKPERKRFFYSLSAFIAAIVLFAVLAASMPDFSTANYPSYPYTTKDFAVILFSRYWLQIEMVSMILFAAIAAAWLFLSKQGGER